ncbi:putative NAD(FAD)-dependent dehydrogenase [Clostridium aceticum]|uniref:Putative NAD(FAD)-dependent dehydrogenase n=1 Tax=Clostridium aceticum TaxID=84022 RepID=A0A0D8I7T3_9CLOT|nr:putative NAD(FAD)-dependent dehydrogenase [Clostridium aceticum]KJF26129.1 CoA-disulfide reductase [Clostridium aceticum]
MKRKVIIVGGVAGGASAAARLRRLDENAEIIMIERGEHISFANCGLPYHVGGIIEKRDALLVQTVAGMSKRFNMDIRNLSEVIKVDADKKVITIKNLSTNHTYDESYDFLVLSPGANPIKPPITGMEDTKNLFTLRNIPDTDAIKSFIGEKQPQSAVVIGGGFIGVEMAENLHKRGVKVTLIEASDQVMGPIDYEMACILHNHIISQGVDLILKDGVKSFEEQGEKIVLQSGREIKTDLIIFSIGVSPENHLAKTAGLQLGTRGGIQVNQYLQTSDPYIYAIGDAIEVNDFIHGIPTIIPLAGPANKQGRIVANNICGKKEKYPGTLGTAVAKVFDMTVASTGSNEKVLKKLGTGYKALHIHPGSHAGYYPSALPIAMKLLFDLNTGQIFGAQAVGYTGVEKRIDVLATAIIAGLKVSDLKNLELSYAPPFSSAKDPVNMLGFVASNLMEDLVDTIQWHEVDDILKNHGLLVDIREDAERKAGFIHGSIHIPLGELRNRLSELPKDETIYLYCQVGLRGYIAARILKQHGYGVKNLDGGLKTYQSVFHSNAPSPCVEQVEDTGVTKTYCQ